MSLDAPTSTTRMDDHDRLRDAVQQIRNRADQAVPWEPSTVGVPETVGGSALLRATDIAFYANARDEVATLTEMCLKLLALHRPRDGGGITSNPEHPPRRCGCCMAYWPCPTIQEMARQLADPQ